MRQVLLNDFSGGVNRLRTKGGASEKYLYTLENAYVTHENTIQSRPASVAFHKLPAGTKGLAAFQNKLHVFADTIIAMTDDRFVCNVIKHPTNPDASLYEIHKAVPFVGHLYVVAEFIDGDVYHYWLRNPDTWSASTDYLQNDLVIPSVPNGYAYRARRLGSARPAWAAGTARAVNDTIEPTVYNGFYFTVTAVYGTNPSSGQVEPAWNASAGATTIESSDGQVQAPVVVTTPVIIGPQPGTGPGSPGYGGNDPVFDPGTGPGTLEP
jgi:hypothetical protein